VLFFPTQSFPRHKTTDDLTLFVLLNLKIHKSWLGTFFFVVVSSSSSFFFILHLQGDGSGATSSESLEWELQSRVFSEASWPSTVQPSGTTFPSKVETFFCQWVSDKRTRECALCPLPSGAQTKPHSSQKTENSFLPPDQEGAGTPNQGATTQWVRGDLRFESDIVSNRRPLGIVTQGIWYRRLVGWLVATNSNSEWEWAKIILFPTNKKRQQQNRALL
jgi:hypothetical protein